MPVVRGDGLGTVFAVWRKRIGLARWDLYASRFAAGVWSPQKIETIDLINNNTASVFNPALGVNGSGLAVATWYYTNAMVPDVYANVFH
ncbi:MAG TPA: hypothetical protein VIF57_19925 [Polyangia bacterium]|jgi:hypothetical protein